MQQEQQQHRRHMRTMMVPPPRSAVQRGTISQRKFSQVSIGDAHPPSPRQMLRRPMSHHGDLSTSATSSSNAFLNLLAVSTRLSPMSRLERPEIKEEILSFYKKQLFPVSEILPAMPWATKQTRTTEKMRKKCFVCEGEDILSELRKKRERGREVNVFNR
jgi:hypothetical protein